MLTLFEELLTLAIHEDKGNVISSALSGLQFGLAGALLAQLALQEKISITEDHRICVVNTEPAQDEILDETAGIIQASDKERKINHWIDTFSQKPDKFRKQLIERLVQRGVVSEEEDRLAWVVPGRDYPEIEASTKFVIKRHLRSIILANEPASLHDIALLMLAKSSGLFFLLFLRDERKLAARRTRELMVEAAMKDPIAETIEEIAVALEGMIEED